MVTSRNDKGQFVNFFGEAIADDLEISNFSIQALYAYDGGEKFATAWEVVEAFGAPYGDRLLPRGLSGEYRANLLAEAGESDRTAMFGQY